MDARYRRDYMGEFVILETRWSGSKKTEKREWVANPIENRHLSGMAACIASETDQDDFRCQILETHNGGLLASRTLQTYGTAKIAQIMRLDFAVDIDLTNIEPLIENGYIDDNIVYTTARNCILKPGIFYLIPLNPHLSAEALPLYLAAFDGHKEIYMIGYNKESPNTRDDWIQQVASVIRAYSGTKFIMVGNKDNMPEEWLALPNTDNFTYRHFISYCDV